MIFFRQFKGWSPRIGTSESGLIETAETVKELEKKYSYCGESILQGNVIDLESGEIISRSSCYNIPAWVLDPTVRAIRVAQWKQQTARKQTKERQGKT